MSDFYVNINTDISSALKYFDEIMGAYTVCSKLQCDCKANENNFTVKLCDSFQSFEKAFAEATNEGHMNVYGKEFSSEYYKIADDTVVIKINASH